MIGEWTPLTIAAYKGYTEYIPILLEAGARKNFIVYGNRARDYARMNNFPEIVRMLEP